MAQDYCLGCNLIHASPVQLHDGATVCSSCEAWRHECEARRIMSMQGKVARQAELLLIQHRRGRVTADALRSTIQSLWEKK